MKNLRMQQEMTDRGRLEIRVNARIQARPVSGARVTVSYTGDPQNVIEELITDGDGRTETLDLATPPLEYSLEPNVNQPYSEYTLTSGIMIAWNGMIMDATISAKMILENTLTLRTM